MVYEYLCSEAYTLKYRIVKDVAHSIVILIMIETIYASCELLLLQQRCVCTAVEANGAQCTHISNNIRLLNVIVTICSTASFFPLISIFITESQSLR